MNSRKGNGKSTPKGDFSFRLETRATRKRSSTTRIEPIMPKLLPLEEGMRMFPRKGDNQDYPEHQWMTYKHLFLEQLDLNTGGLRHPTHMITPSPSCDSSSEEYLPRVRSSIQMNIEEVSTLAVLIEDVAKDTPHH
ncbi:hypothetical protein POTOM_061265 [Populus tomentosa]|uniref:Uncharacterized protein n=1 Tax=Populus tomentosa TaxID=118781 RepID=A0A8X7XTF6_POPTO|nr:hypothetical protein POTOM_061265 [Populus tomentosa]